jgi:hypothetical protein
MGTAQATAHLAFTDPPEVHREDGVIIYEQDHVLGHSSFQSGHKTIAICMPACEESLSS